MTTRRIWRPTTTSSGKVGREYSCLADEDTIERVFSMKYNLQRRTTTVPPRAKSSEVDTTTSDHRKSRSKLVRSSDHRHPLALHTGKLKGEVSQAVIETTEVDALNFDFIAPICWPDFCTANDERVRGIENDEDDDDEHSHDTNSYVAKYYHSKSIYPKLRKPIEHSKHHRDQIHLLFDKQQRYSCNDNHKELGLSQSFETQETQFEESSETSLCTTDDDEELSRLPGSSVEGNSIRSDSGTTAKKRIRWLDIENPGCAVVTHVHELDYISEPSYTCRVVFLLLMDRGPQSSAGNYEFLHCEFRHDDRIRVCDALPQISRLVLGTPENPSDKVTPLETGETFRPFTRLYLDGKELINTLALQDYCLEDGQSTLVALREPPPSTTTTGKSILAIPAEKQRRDELLRQSSLLLADKCLRRGIRKARIAGRSLQILYGQQGLIEEERRVLDQSERGDDMSTDDDEEDTDTDVDSGVISSNTDGNVQGWSVFDRLTRNSFDDDDWNNIAFDVDFFEGTNFFRPAKNQIMQVN